MRVHTHTKLPPVPLDAGSPDATAPSDAPVVHDAPAGDAGVADAG